MSPDCAMVSYITGSECGLPALIPGCPDIPRNSELYCCRWGCLAASFTAGVRLGGGGVFGLP